MSKILKLVQLHTGFHLPNLGGEVSRTLPPVNKVWKDFKMVLEDNASITCTWVANNRLQTMTVSPADYMVALHEDQPIPPQNTASDVLGSKVSSIKPKSA